MRVANQHRHAGWSCADLNILFIGVKNRGFHGYNFHESLKGELLIQTQTVLRILTSLALLAVILPGCASKSSGTNEANQPLVYIQNNGSDTIVNLALAWAEEYQKVNNSISVSVTGGGSGTGIASLISGTVDIANASRAMKIEEIEQAREAGVDPVEHVIARDAIAVIVNPSNPVGKLTLEQIAAIYKGEINNWMDVGGENRPIVRLSRESNSGTHVYFLEEVLRLGSKDDKSLFSMDTLLLPSSEGIIAEVRDNPNAIGYDGLGYVVPEVKVVAVSPRGTRDFVMPSEETVNAGVYPISRDLYMYSASNARPEIDAYLQWILSEDAQNIVKRLGFVPVRR